MTPFKKAQILVLVVLAGCSQGNQKESTSLVKDTILTNRQLPLQKSDKNLVRFSYKILSRKQLQLSGIQMIYDNTIYEKKTIVNGDTVRSMIDMFNKEYRIKQYYNRCFTNEELALHFSPQVIEVLGQKIIFDSSIIDGFPIHINGAYTINMGKNKFIILMAEPVRSGRSLEQYYWLVFEIWDRKHIKKFVLYNASSYDTNSFCFGDFNNEGKLQFLPVYESDTILYPLTYINDSFLEDTTHYLIVRNSGPAVHELYTDPPDLIDIKRSKWYFKLN